MQSAEGRLQQRVKKRTAIEDLFAIHAYIRFTCQHCRDAKRFLTGLAARWNGDAGAETSVQPDPAANETRLNFGRYAGMTLREIAGQDTEYLRWLSRHSSGLRYRAEIERILGADPQASYSPRASR